MINTMFSKKLLSEHPVDLNNYILPEKIRELILAANISLPAEPEKRLQEIYTDEIWNKIDSLYAKNGINWPNSEVLDVASGSGFLSYHLLRRVQPKKLVLLDISPTGLDKAKELIEKDEVTKEIVYMQSDILKSGIASNSFDIIIGNSFIHHFYDVPEGLSELNRLLKPGGIFMSLHEPTPAAVGYEPGNFKHLILWLMRGRRSIEVIRSLKGDFSLDKNAGGDVWLFEKDDIADILHGCGFENILIRPRHIFRAFFAGLFKLHLNEKKDRLSQFETGLIKLANYADSFLSKFLPAKCFGSLVICARKKN